MRKSSATEADPRDDRPIDGGPGDRHAVVIGLLWSLSATALAAAFLIPYRYAVEGAPRLTAMTGMFVVAAVFNGAVALVQTRNWRFGRVAIRAAVGLAVLTIIGNLGTAFSLPDIGAGMTSVVLKAQVVLTPILGLWLLNEQMSGRFWFGAVLAMAGVALPALLDSDGWVGSAGYAWAFMSALGFAGMQILTRRVIDHIEPAAVNALRLVIVVVALQALPQGRAAWAMPAEIWWAAAAAGVLGPGLSRLSLMYAVRYVSPSVTALVALVGPVFAFALGGFFFGETPGLMDLIGAGFILTGVVWSLLPALSRGRRRAFSVRGGE